MTTKPRLALISLSLILILPSASYAASHSSWDGTWSGLFNKSKPVSVTISGGKVVSYAIMGASPYPVSFSKVTYTTVSFGDNANYSVRMTKKGDRNAVGFAHSPIGDGSASLTRQ